MEYKKAEASIFQGRIVCGECGFKIAEVIDTKPEDENGGKITVLCRRRGKDGEPCNTVNAINL